MEYRGIKYKVVAAPGAKWRWTVDFTETKFKTGVSLSKAAAIAKALEVIQGEPLAREVEK
jgi:hypothetical protein